MPRRTKPARPSVSPPAANHIRIGHAAEASRSPLWMITQEPQLTRLVHSLSESRSAIQQGADQKHTLIFSRAELADARAAFGRMIRGGESGLHRLAELLCDTFFEGPFEMESVVIGEIDTVHERFTLTQTITRADLYSHTDLDLGSRQLQRLRYFDGTGWSRANLVANFVEYQPMTVNPLGIHKLISRIKAEEEIWNKVIDEIFDLDRLIRRDKKLRSLSRYVKDVFGLKIVVGAPAAVRKLHRTLEKLRWEPDLLLKRGIACTDLARRLDFVETKNYLGPDGRKSSGWEAMKSVVRWCETTFEIQIQPLGSYLRERETLTRESHDGFKSRREQLRNQVARQLPLFGFYRDLLRWLFLLPDTPPPSFPNIQIMVES